MQRSTFSRQWPLAIVQWLNEAGSDFHPSRTGQTGSTSAFDTSNVS
jgi:hypothetical protein